MAASAILDFCTMLILTVNPIFNRYFKFSANACNSGRVMAKNVIFNMAAAVILDFVRYEFSG